MNDAAEFVYVRTYSRWSDDLTRRETWNETVDRYVDFLVQERGTKIPEKVIKKIKSYILSLDVMPSMRALWAAGSAAKQSNVTMYNCSFLNVDSVESFSECLYILCCGTGVGFSVEKKYIDKLPIVIPKNITPAQTFYIPDTKEGWSDSVKTLMSRCYQGLSTEFDYSLIRPKGTRLKTMGGRSSGPEPLILLHGFIKELFNKAQGRKLTSLECHDVMNKIAEIVVVGGVRRSSQISLSDLEDKEMRHAKDWPFPNHRSMANNSAVYYDKPTAVDFLKEWSSLAASGTGERGISNLGSARKMAPKRRKGELIQGFNPCVVGETEVLTDDGYFTIESLVDKEISIWNGYEWSKVVPKITGTNQAIRTITTSDGRSLNCTNYHKFHISTNYRGDTRIVNAIDLKPGMKLIKHDFPIIEHGPNLEFAYTNGFVAADGMECHKTLYVYEPKTMCLDRIENIKSKKWEPHNKRHRITLKDSPMSKNFVPIRYNLKSKIEWLSGLFDGDGCELKEGGLQLSSVNNKFLNNLQKLLTTVGVQSKIVDGEPAGYRELPDGKGDYALFYCERSYRICVGAVQIQNLKRLGLRCERLLFEKTPNRDASQFITVINNVDAGVAEVVYCFNEPKRHLGIFNGMITGQCHEIALRDKQFCNLSSVVIRPEDDLDSLLEKVETATWIGVIQATFTDFPYLRSEWKSNCEEERLLGVSLSGQMDNPSVLSPDALKALKSRAVKVAAKASISMGVNQPTAITCVKPEGTSSQVVSSGSGLHPWYSEYMIRRYRISDHDPLLKMMKDQDFPMKPENGQTEKDATTWVVSFPVKAPKGAVVKNDLSALDQLEHYKKIQTNWCEHNASATIYCKDSEWFDVGNWVYKNWDIVNGLSFLPHDGGKYKQAPLEAITKEQYDEMVKNFVKIDYSKLSDFEQEDNTEGAKTLACVGGACEI